VTKFAPPDIRDIFFIRSGLENLAADLIIDQLNATEFAELVARIEEQGRVIAQGNASLRSKLDMAFHERLVALSGNSRLLEMWRNIYIQCAMAFNYHTVTMPDYDHMQGVRDHTAILNALRSGDVVNVYAVNNEINTRVARQCIEGLLAVDGQL
jgi:DNA-binding GntR family transcriptional regulator